MSELMTITNMLTLVAIVLIGVGGYTFIQKNKTKRENRVATLNNNKLKDEISDRLEELEKDFMDIATSYYLRLELLESDFSTKRQKEILSNYQKVLSEPKLKWNNFVIINKDGNILNKLIEDKIKDYTDRDRYMVKDAYNYMLLSKAEKRAKKIIESRYLSVKIG